MSNEALAWAFKQQMPVTRKMVLVSLADYADEEGSCFPSHAKTAERSSCSRPTVIRAIDDLASWGYLRVESRSRGGGSQASNRYVLSVGWSPDEGVANGESVAQQAGYHTDTPGYHTDTPRGITLIPPGYHTDTPLTPIEPLQEPTRSSAVESKAATSEDREPESRDARQSDDPPGFDDWWKHYPRKEAKGDARKAFKAALRKTDLATLIATTKRYATEVRGTERKFQKLPGGWLRDERWLDYGSQPAEVTDEQVVELLGPDNWQPDTSGMSFATVDEEMKYRRRVLAERHEARRDEARRMLEAAGS